MMPFHLKGLGIDFVRPLFVLLCAVIHRTVKHSTSYTGLPAAVAIMLSDGGFS